LRRTFWEGKKKKDAPRRRKHQNTRLIGSKKRKKNGPCSKKKKKTEFKMEGGGEERVTTEKKWKPGPCCPPEYFSKKKNGKQTPPGKKAGQKKEKKGGKNCGARSVKAQLLWGGLKHDPPDRRGGEGKNIFPGAGLRNEEGTEKMTKKKSPTNKTQTPEKPGRADPWEGRRKSEEKTKRWQGGESWSQR